MSRASFIIIIILLTATKLFFAHTSTFNFEGAFTHLAEEITNSQNIEKSLYFKLQANPIGTSVFLSGLDRIWQFESPLNRYFYFRFVFAILGLAFLYFLSSLLKRSPFNIQDANLRYLFLLYVFLHPSIWLFSGRILSDAPYFFISSLVLLLAIQGEYTQLTNRMVGIISAACFTILFFKFNVLALVGTILAVAWFQAATLKGQFFNPILEVLKSKRIFYLFSIVVGLTAYYALTQKLNIPFRHNNESLIQISPWHFFKNFQLYSTHYFIINLPLSLGVLYLIAKKASPYQRIGLISSALIASLLFALFYKDMTLMNVGELNFGGVWDRVLTKYLNLWHLPAVILASTYTTFLGFGALTKKLTPLQRALCFTIIVTFVGHSFLKPIQRYTLYITIINALLAYTLYGPRLSTKVKQMAYIVLVIFLGLNLFMSYTSKIQTDTYYNLGQWVRQQNAFVKLWSFAGHLYGNIPRENLVLEGDNLLCVYQYQREAPVMTFRNLNRITNNDYILSIEGCPQN